VCWPLAAETVPSAPQGTLRNHVASATSRDRRSVADGALAEECGRIAVSWHVQEGVVNLMAGDELAFSPRDCLLNEGSRILKELVQRNLLGQISRVVGPEAYRST
jgi:hypothetical protein